MTVDIVDIKKQIKEGKIIPYIRGGNIYLSNECGEIVCIGTIQESKTGRWTRELIRNEYGGCIGAKMICSECGQDNGYDKRLKFCPNCGAKMEV